MVATTEIPREMTALDQALQTLCENRDDAKRQSNYYDILAVETNPPVPTSPH